MNHLSLPDIGIFVAILSAIVVPVVSHTKLASAVEHLTDAIGELKDVVGDGLKRIDAVEKDVEKIKTIITGKL